MTYTSSSARCVPRTHRIPIDLRVGASSIWARAPASTHESSPPSPPSCRHSRSGTCRQICPTAPGERTSSHTLHTRSWAPSCVPCKRSILTCAASWLTSAQRRLWTALPALRALSVQRPRLRPPPQPLILMGPHHHPRPQLRRRRQDLPCLRAPSWCGRVPPPASSRLSRFPLRALICSSLARRCA